MTNIRDLPTPALCIDGDALERNLLTMAAARPGAKLRPHVKAHKCSELALRQRAHGHTTFTCATALEALRLAEAGLGEDILVANEIIDPARLRSLASLRKFNGARLTLAIDSTATVEAAARAGIHEILIDVNVGMPRCGCPVGNSAALADLAKKSGLVVRGVMGYEGHAVGIADRAEREAACGESMALLKFAHDAVGGDVISAGGTGTYDCNRLATEIQAGSYLLMDKAYGELGLPFERALFVWSTVISASDGYVVADAGSKCFGMDHGNPSVDGLELAYCSDEHSVIVGDRLPRVGERLRIWPAHVDPTVACHEKMHVIDDETVVDTWPVDMRGW
jgi:D-serine deaminase-like pyridoxal phosphate-dependent protein